MTESAIHGELIRHFCENCQWIYRCYKMRRIVFDDNQIGSSNEHKWGYFLHDLDALTQEYVLLQVVKLHDPAIQSGRANLSLEYVLRFGGWSTETREKLDSLKTKMEELLISGDKLRMARNRVLSHFDLEAIIEDKPLGSFEEGADIEYFKLLQEFVDIVHEKGPYPLECAMSENDYRLFAEFISR